jgi:hypothetical protein
MHSEATPAVLGIDRSTGEPAFDETKGGLKMDRERTSFDRCSSNEQEFMAFLQTSSSKKVDQTSALCDSAMFFFSPFSLTLAENRTNFLGPRFAGPCGDAEKALICKAATAGNQACFADGAFTALDVTEITDGIVCELLCFSPTGPSGDGSPCDSIPSQAEPGKLFLCEVPLETAAFFPCDGVHVVPDCNLQCIEWNYALQRCSSWSMLQTSYSRTLCTLGKSMGMWC